jgi:1L-myo-inositol 1-phosphate cytidylyltransferase
MNCLIIAAGEGSRLRSLSSSKPLAPVAGKPLIQHVIEAAATGGAGAFTVVTGHEAARVEAFLATLPYSIETVRLADWSRPNGHSVLAGAEAIGREHLLAMCDHLFEPAIVSRLLEGAPAPLTLAVDRDLHNPSLDMDDATKVATDQAGNIVRIGKALDRFDAIDTGLFRAGPELAEALRGVDSLSEGVQRLADGGRARTIDVTGLRWLDVDDPKALAEAERLYG